MDKNSANNYEKARARMVNEQLIPRGIVDPQVLKAMKTVPRHLFVEEALEQQAYGDFPLPIGEGQTISQPFIVALMTQALGLKGGEKVLEVGTGCGYQAAVLAQLCEKVFTVERLKPLYKKARKIFDELHYLNIISKLDDGTVGWSEYAPFNGIMVTASGPNVPKTLIDQLTDPGVLVMPVGIDKYSQNLIVVTKKEGKLSEETIERVRFVDLIGQYGW